MPHTAANPTPGSTPRAQYKDSPRLASVDAYRGAVMFLMLAEVLRLPDLAKQFPNDPWWVWLGTHQSHVTWRGCTLHDLIQPSFSFLVGTSLALSLARTGEASLSLFRRLAHATYRALMLIWLGVFLRSLHADQTNWTFEDTLTQIGLGYLPLVMIGLARAWVAPVAAGVILLATTVLFMAYPTPTPNFFAENNVGVPVDWPHHPVGFAAHWDKNSNVAWAFDTWFLNLFPRAKPFEYNAGGYCTLNALPTLATMIFGLIAGRALVRGVTVNLLSGFLLAGALLLAAGFALDHFQIIPNVKRIWTTSWTLFSGGWCVLILGLFVLLTDLVGFSGWAYPLKVIGANSIAAYLGAHLAEDFLLTALKRHLPDALFTLAGADYERLLLGVGVLIFYWLALWGLYRRKLFLKI